VAKVETSNSDRTISLKRLQCVVKKNNNRGMFSFKFVKMTYSTMKLHSLQFNIFGKSRMGSYFIKSSAHVFFLAVSCLFPFVVESKILFSLKALKTG
jgi:hypothetical protein